MLKGAAMASRPGAALSTAHSTIKRASCLKASLGVIRALAPTPTHRQAERSDVGAMTKMGGRSLRDCLVPSCQQHPSYKRMSPMAGSGAGREGCFGVSPPPLCKQCPERITCGRVAWRTRMRGLSGRQIFEHIGPATIVTSAFT